MFESPSQTYVMTSEVFSLSGKAFSDHGLEEL